MKDKFEELYFFMKKNHELSEWVQNLSLKDSIQELKGEIDEMSVELDKNDFDKFRVELGDVFWDLLGVIVKAENEGHLNVKEFLNEIHEKYKQRKPFLLENKSVGIKEEWRIWEEVKKKERTRKD